MKGGGLFAASPCRICVRVKQTISFFHGVTGAHLLNILKAIIDWLKQPTEYEYEDEIEVLFGKKTQDE